MEETKKKYVMKPLEEMNVIDDFLFTEIMADEKNGLEVCRMILSCVLKRKVGNISFTAQKTVPGVSEGSHGIRLDAYVTERRSDCGVGEYDISVYDVEPDKCAEKKADLPRRSRYYGDLIDVQLLERNTGYDKLPELVTIFILSYDPFGEDAMYYEAGSELKTHPGIEYDDGIRRIFLYVGGKLSEQADGAERQLKNLLVYINDSTAENATDDNTRKLDAIVRSTKARKGIGIKYMKSWERERFLKEIGREEGRAEGRAEGREEGIELGSSYHLIMLIKRKIEKNEPLELIADELETTADEIRPFYDAIIKNPALEPSELLSTL
ncbi:MAG: Rpn family recombination-promoting nuclease/putative transposase [Lachnospiraceae bacterium]|nr:Rpn family recombination-promoting nuclease/putative transposase [Lachnospiraceae bacterium]